MSEGEKVWEKDNVYSLFFIKHHELEYRFRLAYDDGYGGWDTNISVWVNGDDEFAKELAIQNASFRVKTLEKNMLKATKWNRLVSRVFGGDLEMSPEALSEIMEIMREISKEADE